MSETRTLRVVVVGGGITGLAAAHRLVELSRAAARPIELTLLEADTHLGGVVRTERSEGFVIELGPDSILTEHPWAVALCNRIDLEPRMVGTRDEHRRTFVVRDGRLQPLPEGFLLMAPTRFLPVLQSQLFSWPGKLRMALDLVLPRGGEADESLGRFVRRRLGREALERVVQPLVGGIYTADPERLSLAATMPRFLDIERDKRSLILGMWANQRRATVASSVQSGARWSLFTSVDDGLQTLVDTLAHRLPEGTVRLDRPVTSIERDTAWRVITAHGENHEADAVIVALPAFHGANLLRGIDAPLARELEAIEYASTAIVNIAFEENHLRTPLEGFGFVVPQVERRSIIACSYSSMKWPGRAPTGRVLLRVFVGGALQPDLLDRDDEALVTMVRRELADLLGLHAEPLLTRVSRWMHSMPQYHVGHLARLERIDDLLSRHPGLHLAGNAYRGVGIPHCIHSGETAAERALAAVSASKQ